MDQVPTGRTGKGRKGHEYEHPEIVELARTLSRTLVMGRLPTLRQVAERLAAAGYVSANGTPLSAAIVSRLLYPSGSKIAPCL